MRDRVLSGERLVALALAALAAAPRGVGAAAAGASATDAPVDGSTGAGTRVDSSRAAGPGADPAAIIAGSSLCPRPDEVWSALETLMPRERLEARARERLRSALPVEIVDLGVPYRVIAAGRVREYRDEARDCAQRARVAAVFVALALDPAEFTVEIAPPAAPPESRPPQAVTPPPPAARAARFELGAIVQAAPATSGDGAKTGGLALRAALGRGALALVAGASALAPGDLDAGGQRVRQWRLPADIGVRGTLPGRQIELSGEVGLAAAWLTERALDVVTARSRSAFELGARVAAVVRFRPAARLAPFVAVHAEAIPSPAALYVLPRGVVGHTPSLWIGLTAGASLSN